MAREKSDARRGQKLSFHTPCLCKRPFSLFTGENFLGGCHLEGSASLRGRDPSSLLSCSVTESPLSGFSGFIRGAGTGDGLLANVIHRLVALFVISQPILARGDASRRNFVPLICGSHLRKLYVELLLQPMSVYYFNYILTHIHASTKQKSRLSERYYSRLTAIDYFNV